MMLIVPVPDGLRVIENGLVAGPLLRLAVVLEAGLTSEKRDSAARRVQRQCNE